MRQIFYLKILGDKKMSSIFKHQFTASKYSVESEIHKKINTAFIKNLLNRQP